MAPLEGSELSGLGSVPTAAGAAAAGAGGPFPGFGPAPPAVAATSAAGATGLASDAGHTHAGVESLTGAEGITPGSVTRGALTVGQTLKATWPVANTRWFAVDGAGGSDLNVGFSDTSSADAWTKRVATIGALAKILPKLGAGRTAAILIGSGGQTYTDSLDLLYSGSSGYALLTARGTTTGTESVADLIVGGWVTATGMNAAGYKPVAAFSTSIIKCTKADASAPGFAAEPAIPCGARIRFDAATTTAALRNIVRTVIRVAGTDTLYTSTVLPATPVGTDVFYIEMPGWTAPATNLWHGNTQARAIGGNITGAVGFSGSASLNANIFAGCWFPGSVAVRAGNWANNSATTFPGIASSDVGSCRLASTFTSSASQVSFGAGLYTGVVNLQGMLGYSMNQSFFAGGMELGGGAQGLNEVNSVGVSNQTLGTLTAGLAPRFLRTGNSAIIMFGVNIQIGQLVFVAGSARGLDVRGVCDLENMGSIVGAAGSMTNEGAALSDCGVDFANTVVAAPLNPSSGTRFRQGIGNASTTTGTNGAIRLAGGFFITWAQLNATGIADIYGNRLVAPQAGPLGVVGKFSGVLITDALLATSTFLGDPGFQPLLNANGTPDAEYPTSLRLITRMRVFLPTGSGLALVVTLFKRPFGGANAATAMVVNVPAGTAVAAVISDLAHPILFADGDTFSVQVAAAASAEGNKPLTVTLEGPC